MNPTANYIENLLNVKDPYLNFVDCSQTTYKGRKVIMCTAIVPKSLTSIATSLTPLNVRSLSDSLKIIL